MALSVNCSATALSLSDISGVDVLSISAFEQRNLTFLTDPNSATNSGTHYGLNFCNATVTYTHPGWNDSIQVSVFLPTENWNGRFAGVGGGGFVAGMGAIGESLMVPYTAVGYATASTDAGHTSNPATAAAPELDWALTSPGNVNWPLLMDFADVAQHDTANIAKSLIEVFYGSPPSYSYFHGGSTGGRQGQMLAQRYPDDYDGIVSAFPAMNWGRMLFSSSWPLFTMEQLGYVPRPCELDAIRAAILSACDGLDGVEDGIISREDLCDFSPFDVVGQSIDCDVPGVTISSQAATVVNETYAGPRGLDGRFQWYGYSKAINFTVPMYGPILTECNNGAGPCEGVPFDVTDAWVRYFVLKDPTFSMRNITHQQWDDFTRASLNQYGSIMDTSDPDLSAFKRRGGKMVHWHGTADPGVAVNGSVDYYERVLELDPAATDFYRFFVAPGVGHCYGCGPSPAISLDFIADWVERDIAPDTLLASGPVALGVQVERPLCVYPQVQHYTGGDSTLASSFTCV